MPHNFFGNVLVTNRQVITYPPPGSDQPLTRGGLLSFHFLYKMCIKKISRLRRTPLSRGSNYLRGWGYYVTVGTVLNKIGSEVGKIFKVRIFSSKSISDIFWTHLIVFAFRKLVEMSCVVFCLSKSFISK